MASCIVKAPKDEIVAGMGQIAVGRDDTILRAVLGSCIGVVLYAPRQHVGALGHVVLPQSEGRQGAPGKFADTAIPAMLRALEREGARPTNLIAKIAGGASMFGHDGPMQIGEANAQAVTEVLRAAGIRIAEKDVGGKRGRRVYFHCQNGKYVIETVGDPPRVL